MTDTTHLSGYLLDYYAALAENIQEPKLIKHSHEETYICAYWKKTSTNQYGYLQSYSPTTTPALVLPIIERLIKNLSAKDTEVSIDCGNVYYFATLNRETYQYDYYGEGNTFAEAALRALVAWKFPDGLPEPIYESEK